MSSSSICDLFPFHVFEYTMKFLDVPDIVHAEEVCKSWKNAIETSASIWKSLFDREGIPLVSGNPDHPRDYKKDFMMLYPNIISGKDISQFLGTVIEPIPPIQEEWFLKLKEKDPFVEEEEEGELVKKNYVLAVIPSLVMRKDQATPLALDQWSNLIINPQVENNNNPTKTQDLRIPYSFENLKVLCSYPLKGKENMPVFNNSSRLIFPIPPPAKVSVVLIRMKGIVHRGLTYPEQKSLVEKKGFKVASLIQLVTCYAMNILKKGTCPNMGLPSTYARTADPASFQGNPNVFRPLVGGFIKGQGLVASFSLRHLDSSEDPYVGVVPCISVEVGGNEKEKPPVK